MIAHTRVETIGRCLPLESGKFCTLFYNMVVLDRMRSARECMERELAPERWRHSSSKAATQAIMEEMMRGLHGAGAGVVRTTLKRGHFDRGKLEPLRRYRSALTDRAVTLLAHRAHIRQPVQTVRFAMQMAEATALDALLHDTGTLRAGSQRMADALGEMMLCMLGLSRKEHGCEDTRGNERAEQAADRGEEKMLEMPIEEVVALPIPEPTLHPLRAHGRKAARVSELEPIQIVNPKDHAPEKAEQQEPQRRRRYRPRL